MMTTEAGMVKTSIEEGTVVLCWTVMISIVDVIVKVVAEEETVIEVTILLEGGIELTA